MDKALFQNVAPQEREQMLHDNADSIEQIGYMRYMDGDEIAGHKDSLAELSIKINDLEEQIKDYKAQINLELKPLKDERGEVLQLIKEGAEFVEESCFKMIDHEDGMVGYYNKSGILVQSRQAKPNEKQTSIFSLKTGTNE